MELSIFVAKIIALVYLSAGVAAISGKMNYSKIIQEFEKSYTLVYLSGLFAIILGMILVQYHNIWVKDWPVLITIIGWIAVVKGIMFIAFPESISWFKSWFKNIQMWGWLLLIIGVIFGYFGFVA